MFISETRGETAAFINHRQPYIDVNYWHMICYVFSEGAFSCGMYGYLWDPLLTRHPPPIGETVQLEGRGFFTAMEKTRGHIVSSKLVRFFHKTP